MTTDDVVPGTNRFEGLMAMLPALLGQLYLLWLVTTGRLNYVQVAVSVVVEVLLVLLISALLLSPNPRTALNRMFELVVSAVCLAMVLQVLLLMPVRDHAAPFADAIASLATIKATYPHMLQYLGIVLGASCVSALASGDARFWWYGNITAQAGVTFIAMFLSALLVVPIGALANHMHYSSLVFAAAWTGVFGTMRLLLSYAAIARLSPEAAQAIYAKYAAGVPAPAKKQPVSMKSRVPGLPFLLVGLAILAYGIFDRRADVAYDATALRADGVVVDVWNSVTEHGEDAVVGIIEFNDADGNKVRLKGPERFSSALYRIGVHVTLLYQAGHPEVARIKDVSSPTAFPFIVGGFGFIVASLGLLLVLFPIPGPDRDTGGEQESEKGSFAAMDRIARKQSEER